MLGAYRLVERLGTGGMGTVYRAVHEKLGRAVAIKVLDRAMASDRTNVARFFQEARSVNTIRHPNVVEIYDFVTAGKDIYTVMELLVGQDLHQALFHQGGHPFTPERTVSILEQICAALQAAHGRSIIHRDLKPANVFLTRRQQDAGDLVKLLDFGLAKFERIEGHMTRDGVVLGTPEYMAPEQARGESLDGRVDLYAVGCLGYQMLTAEQLFAGGGYADVMLRHIKETPRPPRELNPAIPEALERAILRSLAKRPEDRPATARAMAEELCAAVGRSFEAARSLHGGGARAGTAVSAELRAPPSATPISLPEALSRTLHLDTPARRNAAVAAVAAAIAVAAVSLVIKLRAPAAARGPGGGRAPAGAAAAPAAGPALQRLVRVRLQSQPEGAAIVDEEGAAIGRTPLNWHVPAGSYRRLAFSLDGYRPATAEFHAALDGAVAVVLEPLPGTAAARAAPGGAQGPRESAEDSPRRTMRPRASEKKNPETQPTDLDSRARTMNPFAR